jgi:hypothetical protein
MVVVTKGAVPQTLSTLNIRHRGAGTSIRQETVNSQKDATLLMAIMN